jgi:hypothetical protein
MYDNFNHLLVDRLINSCLIIFKKLLFNFFFYIDGDFLKIVSFKAFKGILSSTIVIFSYPKLLSFSVLTFIKWRLNTELLANTLRNVVFSI